jgi:uncharacterized DUF497 family protein
MENYALSKNELEAEEYALNIEDAKEIAFILERVMTRKQVESKEDRAVQVGPEHDYWDIYDQGIT